MSPVKKPKLAFKPRRMWVPVGSCNAYASKGAALSAAPRTRCAKTAILIAADSESVEALAELIAHKLAARAGNDWEGYPIMTAYGSDARAMLKILGFKPKATKT